MCLMFTALISLLSPDLPALTSDSLVVHLLNIRSNEGCLQVGIYHRPDDFPDADKGLTGRVTCPKSTQPQRLAFPNLSPGRYAVAVYHDLNENGKLDKNLFGVPVEPYAFSGNPKSKWRPPQFDETAIEFRGPKLELTIELKRWKEHD